MCTVSFVPIKEGFCITSNRDEKITREKAIPPTKYHINNKDIYFPKDPKAGGTWFAHDNETCIVLLNGATEKHISKKNYRKSRGLVVIELITAINPFKEWYSINLQDIEPFTIILFSNEKLHHLQWDEFKKSTIELDATISHIWSSSTLYEKEVREKRANWFKNFLYNKTNIEPQELLSFHQFTESNNKKYGLQINRDNLLKTISITQCIISNDEFSFNYIDLLD